MATISGKGVKKEIMRMDGGLKVDSQDFIEACVLLDSVVIGPNADAIARHLQYKRANVREIGNRARKRGLWVGGKVDMGDDWFGGNGGIAFWLDVAVLKGFIKRRRATKTNPTKANV